MVAADGGGARRDRRAIEGAEADDAQHPSRCDTDRRRLLLHRRARGRARPDRTDLLILLTRRRGDAERSRWPRSGFRLPTLRHAASGAMESGLSAQATASDRTSVVEGKGVSVRVDPG